MWMTTALFSLFAVLLALGPIRALGLPRWATLLISAFCLLLAQHYPLHRFFRASIMSPDLVPLPLLAVALWGAGFLMSGLFFSILWRILRLCHVEVPAWAPLALGAIVGFIMIWKGERQPPLREHVVELSGLPAEADGLRVAVLADIHLDRWRGEAWCRELVDRVNAEKPDLILFTGDQQDGYLSARRDDLKPLADLQAPLGKYLITGNHEYYFDTSDILAYYRTLGLQVIDGDVATVGGLTLLGLPDSPRLSASDNGGLLQTLMKRVPEGAFPVLLVHKPGIAKEADALGVKLQLSGHTHGGQFPGVAMLIARFNNRFVRGWYDLPEGMKLYVTPGSGVWLGFPYRLYSSELTFLTLRRADAEAMLE